MSYHVTQQALKTLDIQCMQPLPLSPRPVIASCSSSCLCLLIGIKIFEHDGRRMIEMGLWALGPTSSYAFSGSRCIQMSWVAQLLAVNSLLQTLWHEHDLVLKCIWLLYGEAHASLSLLFKYIFIFFTLWISHNYSRVKLHYLAVLSQIVTSGQIFTGILFTGTMALVSSVPW